MASAWLDGSETLDQRATLIFFTYSALLALVTSTLSVPPHSALAQVPFPRAFLSVWSPPSSVLDDSSAPVSFFLSFFSSLHLYSFSRRFSFSLPAVCSTCLSTFRFHPGHPLRRLLEPPWPGTLARGNCSSSWFPQQFVIMIDFCLQSSPTKKATWMGTHECLSEL
jgi:hypothetical protein